MAAIDYTNDSVRAAFVKLEARASAAEAGSAVTYSAKLLDLHDSIGAGYLGSGHLYWDQMALATTAGITRFNDSVSGIEVSTVLSKTLAGNYDSFYDKTKTCVAVVPVGTNSLGNAGLSAATVYAQDVQLIQALKNKGYYVLLCTILPRLINSSWTSTQETQRLALNSSRRANAGLNGVGIADAVLDLAADSLMGDGPGNTTTYYVDGLHPNAAGQDRLTTIFNNSVLAAMARYTPRPITPSIPSTAVISAVGGNAQNIISLTTGPSANGSPITGYNLFRGLTAGGESITPIASNVALPYTDTGLTNSTQYYYRASAINGVGASPFSSEVSATPTAVAGAVSPLTLTSATFGTGKFAQGMTGGSAVVPTTVQPANAGVPFTVEAWVTFTGSSLSVAAGQSPAGGGGFSWYMGGAADGTAVASVNSGGGHDIATTVNIKTDGLFHHLALVIQAASTQFYVDGILAGSNAFSAPGAGDPATIRKLNFNTGFPWSGTVDEVVFTSGAKYTANFTPPTAATASGLPNTRGIYHLDGDGTGVA